MSNEQTRHCRHMGDDGTPCKAHPLHNRQYCFFHDPAMKTKRAAAGRDGGLMRAQRALADLKVPPDLLTQPLHTDAEISELLREVIVRFCRGEITLRLATTITYMCSILMQSRQKADLGNPIEALVATGTADVETALVQHLFAHDSEAGLEQKLALPGYLLHL
jgi:hypothetical protein